jgi:anaphase-promoting complex subunit 1
VLQNPSDPILVCATASTFPERWWLTLEVVGVWDTSLLDRYDEPPDILTYLSRRLVTLTKPFPTPQSLCTDTVLPQLGLIRPCSQTELVCEIYNSFAVPSTSTGSSMLSRAGATAQLMVDRGCTADWLSNLPCGVAIPILEVLRICQANPVKGWSSQVYDFVGRSDLAIQASGESVVPKDTTLLDVSTGH